MEVEEKRPLVYHAPQKVQLTDGQIILIPYPVMSYLVTLTTMMEDYPQDEDLTIPLQDFITKPILDWVINAHLIYVAERENITEFDELYKNVDAYQRLLTIMDPEMPTLLYLFGTHALPEDDADFLILLDLVRVLNWFSAEAILKLSVDKAYELLSGMTTVEIETLYKERNLKREKEEEVVLLGLPLTPFYKRERLIRDFLGHEIDYGLAHANIALQKHINPIDVMGSENQVYFLKPTGLYREEAGNQLKVITPATSTILLVACGDHHILCLTKIGLYGRGNNDYGQLGIGTRSLARQHEWKRIEIDGEVLMISAGSNFSLVLTTTGLYSFGANNSGQLGIGSDDEDETHYSLSPTRVANVEGDVRHICNGDNTTFVLTTTGLYACGVNDDRQLGIDYSHSDVTILTPVVGLQGNVLSIDSDYEHTAIVTTKGLYTVGSGPEGRLGLGDEEPSVLTLVKLPDDVTPLSVYCGYKFTVVWTTDGLYATGLGTRGVLSNGDFENRYNFTKMLGLEGEIQSVSPGDHSLYVLTTSGLYLSGDEDHYKEEGEKPYTPFFRKLNIDMGYIFSLPTEIKIVDEEVIHEPPQKRIKLHCVYCGGKARGIASHMDNQPFCSRYCILSVKTKLSQKKIK